MKKFLAVILVLFSFQVCAFASISDDTIIQQRINRVGCNILNMNKITKRIVFVYDKSQKKSILSTDKTLTKRQIVVYRGLYEQVASDDELAGMLSREISTALKSYSGIWGGVIDSLQVSVSSKKFETVADKRAVDYMVNAGYNPVASIVVMSKVMPQYRYDWYSTHPLTTRRMMEVYEYIYKKYPEYLANNVYKNNPYYQNFLLTSKQNRAKFQSKIKSGSKNNLKYL